ncbi:MAG: polysaccharide biosynthesis tyrosine autokinase, partial [Deltaproteobacteria bacterium]|nr:polysaccharide biosynthesis tyrosine autokinase [Deltaproteobacteria bacterium]
LMTPIFKGVVMLEITEDNPAGHLGDTKGMLAQMMTGSSEDKFQATQISILSSRSIARQIIQQLNLLKHPEFTDLKDKDPKMTQEEYMSRAIDRFVNKDLVVAPVKDTYLVEVDFKAYDKVMAQKVANAVAKQYMRLVIDRRSESYDLVREWLDKHLDQMEKKLQTSQKKLFAFGQKAEFYSLDDKDNIIIRKFIDLSDLSNKAEAERMGKEAQYKQLAEKGSDAPLVTNNTLIMNLRQAVMDQASKVKGMRENFLGGHPDLQREQAKLNSMQGRLDGEVGRVSTSVKADYEAALKAEKLVKKAFEDQKGPMEKLQDQLVDFNILKRDAETTSGLYQAVLSRMKEASIAATMVPSNVAVIDPPELPWDPWLPMTKIFMAVACLLGLTMGIGAAFYVEHLDDSLKSGEELERVSRFPSLAVVPQLDYVEKYEKKALFSRGGVLKYLPWTKSDAKLQQQEGVPEVENMELITFQKPQSVVSEAIRHLRTSIMLSTPGGAPACMMVCSSSPEEGKTTISTNLSISMASDGRKVLLIDCDLRKPRIHGIFKRHLQPGLSNYLTKNVRVEDIIQSTDVPNLSIIPAGTIPPNPVELLNSERFRDLLEELKTQFHHVIIDTPPILGFSEARIIASLVGGVVLVAKHESTPREAARMSARLLNQVGAQVLGTVLNQVKLRRRGYGKDYYYYYHDKYKSYYAPEVGKDS